MKNNNHVAGNTRKGPSFQTAGSFKAQASDKRYSKHQINPKSFAFRGTRNKAP